MRTQLRFNNFIPVIILLVVSALLLGFFALPHSQYALLGEMTALNNNVDAQGNIIQLNWGTVLPAIFTMFGFILLIVQFCFGILSCFMVRLFTFRLVNFFNVICFSAELVLELLYFFIGLGGKFDDGTAVIETFNYITVIINFLGYAAFMVTYFIFIEKPFREVKEGLKPYIEIQKQERKKEMKEVSQKDEVIQSEKFYMQTTIEKMVRDGKISQEEADKILNELKNNNS